MSDAVDDVLFLEQASTSLYERLPLRTDGSGERHVLPLTRARPTYCKVPPPPSTSQTGDGVDDGSQPEIVVQLRKRNGMTQLFLDGYLSEGIEKKREDGAIVRLHKLNWHRGLHEDVQTDTRVFSPIAIVAAIEDGQRPVQDVTVSVWTTFENQKNPVFESLLVAETRVVPHRVTDARCNTVRAPYPLAYPPPPSLTIFDRMKIERQQAYQILDTLKKGVNSAVKGAKDDYDKLVKVSGTGKEEDWSEPTTWAMAILEGARMLKPSNLLKLWRGEEIEKPELAGSDLTSRALYRGFIGGAMALFATALKWGNWHYWAAVAQATVPYAYDLWQSGGVDDTGQLDYTAAFDIAWNTLKILTNERPRKSEGQTKFTIKELARTIFSLSVMRKEVTTHTLPDEYRRQRSEQFRREQVVWEWLRDVKNEISAPDVTLLDVSTMFATRLHLRIAVDDALNCNPSEAYHEITCGRKDCYELGALAAGTLRDIESLFEAMEVLEKTLDTGITDPSKNATWWDWTLLLPLQARESVMTQFGVLRKGYDTLRKKVQEKKDPKALKAFEEKHADDLSQIKGYEEAMKAQTDGETKTEAEIEQEKKDAEKEAKEQQAKDEAQAKVDAQGDDALLKQAMKAAAKKAERTIMRVRVRAFWKLANRQFKQLGIQALTNISSPAKETRKKILQAVKKGLHEKLARMFLSKGQPGEVLYEKLQKVAEAKSVPVPIAGVCQYVRMLPHRATSHNTKRLFLFRADRSNGFVDVTTRAAATRVYSEYYDANQLIATAMDASATAMHRLVGEWEANSSTRVKLVCMCEDVQAKNPFVERVASSTLVLTTPVDVQAADALVELTERERRQIRLVVRRAQQKGDKSAMERLGLKHDNTSLLVAHVFGNLWADELVALHKLGTKAPQVQMLEQASRRATARLRAAGKLMLDLLTVHNPTSNAMEFDDVPCNATDVALLATQRGRDAGLIIERLLFGQNFVAIRAAFAPLLRAAAQAAGKCADAFDRDIPERLPYEPVASLFDRDRTGGVAAYLRVQRMSSLGDVVSAAAAAYPSVLLLGSDAASQQAAVALANAQGVPEAPTAPSLRFGEVVRAMRYRLASLKMDELPVDAVAIANGNGTIDVDQLALELSSTSLLVPSHSFYVPFGFGDARPPPTLPPLSAPMFGSVPVYGPHLTQAFAALMPTGGKAKRPLRVTLTPTFGCLTPLSNEEGASAHPNVLQVLAADGGGVEVRYTASRVWGVPLPNRETRYGNATAAAEAHRQGEGAAKLAADVCAVAWNAERAMQAVIAALGSASDTPDAHDGLALSLVLPHAGGEQSVWFTKPNNPIAMGAKRAYAARKARFLRLALYHRGLDHQQLARELWDYLKKQEAMDDDSLTTLDTDLTKWDLGALDADVDTVLETSKKRQSVLQALEGKVDSFADQAAEAASRGGPSQAFEDNSEIVREKTKTKLNDLYKDLKTALDAVEKLDADYKEASKRAAEAKAKSDDNNNNDAHARIAHAGLVCALGVGMGMLAPLLGDNVPMQVETIQRAADGDSKPPSDWVDLRGVRNALKDAFGKCDAMRMSEACLVVAGVLSK